VQIDYLEGGTGMYQPGVCNIDGREIAKRRAFGIVSVAGAIGLAALLVAVDAPPLARAIVVLPLGAGLVSLEEARRRFCGAFAYRSIRSATGSGSDATERVTDRAAKAADRAAARWMVAYCGTIAVAITAVFMLLPI
jgi:hypothetical protein